MDVWLTWRLLFKKFFYWFIFGCIGSSVMRELFSICSRWGRPSSCGAQATHFSGFSCCGAQGTRASGVEARGVSSWGSRALAHRHTGLVTLLHVASSWIRDRTGISCIGRQIPHCWTTREAPPWKLFLHPTTPCGRYYLHFTDNCTEAQWDEDTCPKPSSL